ncbi:nuclear transport factor 2 family protein [Blastococcus sp. TML/M2B]|uniref:nuclear transport factor 2 family protein n=1 Tax=unclassified Blastococcus TaxID=2619396 RepID=UPI00190B5A32|nr:MULTISPECIES: nuclear transport factor 2 family protein [unclassified Blastococcus]MBN1091471.1 nuclear transport factor 2 family protein [Blastococcus sp. TML/M2B]MBN1094975.1 nuclear transport factor 2 family protein [Blastococcus sp. TML/C7B]
MDEIQQLVAQNEIRNLVAQYAQHTDDTRIQEWTELFVEDARMEAGGQPLEGRAALTEWITGVTSSMKLRHVMGGHTVTLDSATEAHGAADMILLAAVEGNWILAGAPRYVDKYVKTDAGWRFAERILEDRPAKG